MRSHPHVQTPQRRQGPHQPEVPVRRPSPDEYAESSGQPRRDRVNPTADLSEETDFDSMDFLDLIAALHVRLGVGIPEADNGRLLILRGAVGHLAAKLAAGQQNAERACCWPG